MFFLLFVYLNLFLSKSQQCNRSFIVFFFLQSLQNSSFMSTVKWFIQSASVPVDVKWLSQVFLPTPDSLLCHSTLLLLPLPIKAEKLRNLESEYWNCLSSWSFSCYQSGLLPQFQSSLLLLRTIQERNRDRQFPTSMSWAHKHRYHLWVVRSRMTRH